MKVQGISNFLCVLEDGTRGRHTSLGRDCGAGMVANGARNVLLTSRFTRHFYRAAAVWVISMIVGTMPPLSKLTPSFFRMLQTDTVHRAGDSIELDVDTQDAGDGQLAAVAIGPKGDAVPVEIIANRNRTFTLKLLTSKGGRLVLKCF